MSSDPQKGPARLPGERAEAPAPATVRPPVRATRVRTPAPAAVSVPALREVSSPVQKAPEAGFHNKFATEYAVVNLSTLEQRFADGDTVTLETLLEKKIVRKPYDGLKVLANGELTKKLR